jgi:hypothetical protein
VAIEIPWEVVELMNYYGLPWPDVDEDGFHALQAPLRNFGNDLDAIGDDISNALQDLHSVCPSRSLEAISSYFGGIRRDFLDPVKQFSNDLAGWPCDATYDAIGTLKVTVIAMLLADVGNDAADAAATVLTGGLAAPLAVAEAVAMEAADQTLQALESEAISILEHAAQGVLENFAASLLNPFINKVESKVESQLDTYAPHLALQTATMIDQDFSDRTSSEVLRLVDSHLDQSVEQIGTSVSHLYAASSKLEAAIKEIFSHPQTGIPAIHSLSSVLRTALMDLLDTIRSEFVAAIEELAEHVAKHFITLLHDFSQALRDIDEQAAKLAAAEKMAAIPGVMVLSVAGVAAAASAEVLAASGLVNAEQADSVQVQLADDSSVEGVEGVIASVDSTPLVTLGTAEATEGEDALKVQVQEPTVSVTVQDVTSSSGVETLTVQTDAAQIHTGLVQGGSETTTSVTAASLEGAAPLHEGTATAMGDQSELVVKHADESVPKTANATSEPHEVREVHVHEPAVDGTLE